MRRCARRPAPGTILTLSLTLSLTLPLTPTLALALPLAHAYIQELFTREMPAGEEAGAASGALSSGHHATSGATMSIDHLVFLSQQSLPSKVSSCSLVITPSTASRSSRSHQRPPCTWAA